MTTEILELTAEVVISYASMHKLSTQELLEKIKEAYNVLSTLDFCGVPEFMALENAGSEKIFQEGDIFYGSPKEDPDKTSWQAC
jgi:hypothetical protein